MVKIAVIGGAGYIGSALSAKLVNDGHEVTVIDPYASPVFHQKTIYVHRKFELCDIDLNEFDVVYHLADIASIQKCEKLRERQVTIQNVGTTKAVVDALRKNKHTLLIYTSSSAIYAGASLYSISKLQSEYLVANHHRSISLRLGTVYGISPNMREGILVNDMVKQAITARELLLWHGISTRPYIHVDDCVNYLVRAIKCTPDQPRNVFTEVWKKSNIARIINGLTKCALKEVDVPWRFSQDFVLWDTNRVRRTKGIIDGVYELAEYYAK